MPKGTIEAGDESVELCKIADIVESCLQKEEEVPVQDTQTLKQP
jgi:hypothetical protein